MALLDVIKEMPRALSPKAAMHILARLDDAAAVPLIAVVKARPSDVLLSALAPVESPGLALVVAKVEGRSKAATPSVETLRKGSRHATDGQRWLLRHAGVGALGLVPAAIDAADPAHEDARRALELIAVKGHVAALDHALERYGQRSAAYLDSLRPLLLLATLHEPGCDHIGALFLAGHVDTVFELLSDIEDPRIAPAMARWLSEGAGPLRQRAADWLLRHPTEARNGLQAPELSEAARTLALKILDGTTTVDEHAGVERVPELIPAAPAFFDASRLSAPKLLEGGSLEDALLDHIGTMLRFTALAATVFG